MFDLRNNIGLMLKVITPCPRITVSTSVVSTFFGLCKYAQVGEFCVS